jgi:hypothetical protein
MIESDVAPVEVLRINVALLVVDYVVCSGSEVVLFVLRRPWLASDVHLEIFDVCESCILCRFVGWPSKFSSTNARDSKASSFPSSNVSYRER